MIVYRRVGIGITAIILIVGAAMLWWAQATGNALTFVFSIGSGIRGAVSWYNKHYAAVTPLLTLTAALAVAWVALVRHFAQTRADLQRRITESFAKAVEQLGSDKLEVRLGGIYSLERISTESSADYWTIMENLTAFVRERSRRNEAERRSQDVGQRISLRAYFLWQEAGEPDGQADKFWANAVRRDEDPPAADIAAALTVLKRRSVRSRKRENANDWHLDLTNAILKRADLRGAHLERALLWGAHLEEADIRGAHLEKADLLFAYLKETSLAGAYLQGAHLEKADLRGAYLEWANLEGAYLEGARLMGTHLEGTFLWGVHLDGPKQLAEAHGDATTALPDGVLRPAHWADAGPASEPDAPEPPNL